MYTLEDLEAARAAVLRWDNAYANDSSNNPGKYDAQRRDAGIRLREVTASLKEQGLLPRSEGELLTDELDRLHPNAPSRSIVTHNGKRYQIRYVSEVRSRSRKTTKAWSHHWALVE